MSQKAKIVREIVIESHERFIESKLLLYIKMSPGNYYGNIFSSLKYQNQSNPC